ncbi:hypothetical protein SG26_03195 [Haloarcula sp. CBA1115]|nr:hypothetical protein SG26_03195 [Haloarcula sp. CBA1115]
MLSINQPTNKQSNRGVCVCILWRESTEIHAVWYSSYRWIIEIFGNPVADVSTHGGHAIGMLRVPLLLSLIRRGRCVMGMNDPTTTETRDSRQRRSVFCPTHTGMYKIMAASKLSTNWEGFFHFIISRIKLNNPIGK